MIDYVYQKAVEDTMKSCYETTLDGIKMEAHPDKWSSCSMHVAVYVATFHAAVLGLDTPSEKFMLELENIASLKGLKR